MKFEKLVDEMVVRLARQPIQTRYALSQFKLNNEDYRISAEYTDPIHYPFYYYLGCRVLPKNLIEFGFESGIESGCFIHGCKNLDNYLGFRHENKVGYWSSRLAKHNICNVLKKKINYWNGEIFDPEFLKNFLVRKWDCALIVRVESRDTIRKYLDLVWNQMNLGGIIVVDRCKSNPDMEAAYNEFCKITQRPITILKTRYGTGLIEK
jgi:hypothetical protein